MASLLSDSAYQDAQERQGNARQVLWYALALAAACVLVYFRSIGNDFVGWDDGLHVYENPYLNPPTINGVLHFWSHAYQGLFVPLAYTLFALISHIAQVPSHLDPYIGSVVTVNPWPFHTVSLLIHIANTLLVFAIIRALAKRRFPAFAGALLFAVHPLQTESVAWISELRGVAAAACALWASLIYIKQGDEGGRNGLLTRALCLFLTVCAALFKPTIVVMPIAAFCIDVLVLKRPLRRILPFLSLWVLVCIPFIIATRGAQSVPASLDISLWHRVIVASDAIAFYIAKIFVPIHLVALYGRSPHWLLPHIWAALAIIVPVALLACAWLLRRRAPLSACGILLFGVFLSPVIGLVPFIFQLYSTVADRYAYLPLLGAALIFADIIGRLTPVQRQYAAVAIITIPLAFAAFLQVRFWRGTVALMGHNISVSPQSAAYNDLGTVRLSNGDLNSAEFDFLHAITLDTSNPEPQINLAKVYYQDGRIADSENTIAQAIRTAPYNIDTLEDAGTLLSKLGKANASLSVLARACTLDPKNPVAQYNYGNTLADNGDLPAAVQHLRQAVTLAPNLALAHLALGASLAQQGALPEAAQEFAQAHALDPSNTDAANDLKQAQEILANHPPL